MNAPPLPSSRRLDDCWNRIGVHGDGSCPELATHIHCRNCPVYSTAAVALLDRALPPTYRETWSLHFAKPKLATEAGTTSAVLFRLQDEWLALRTGLIKEVAATRPVHSLPHRRDRIVTGVANVRGELVVCVSLAEVLGLEARAGATARAGGERLLVAEREGSRLVFPVDEVHGIHRFHPREAKPAPATVARATLTYTKGVLAWQNRSVGWLDDELLFHTLNRSLA